MKVLHLSFHTGCQNEIKSVCEQLGITDLTYRKFDDGITTNCNIYNVGHDRAELAWEKYKDFYNSFDIIITSDTAPISRTFLQNNFEKRLIILVCNRFDYAHQPVDCNFPDKEYYDLIRSAKDRPNVRIAGYTPFENYYAKHIRNVDIGDIVLKPVGNVSSVYNNNFIETPVDNKKNTLFIPPYHNDKSCNVEEHLNTLGIPCYIGRYRGPLDLVNFKGVVHIPYAWSNLALFEALSLGIIYFIPTERFLLELSHHNFFWSPPFRKEVLHLSEWYHADHKELFVFFDSWEDLAVKINSTNFDEIRSKMKDFYSKHKETHLNQWKQFIFDN